MLINSSESTIVLFQARPDEAEKQILILSSSEIDTLQTYQGRDAKCAKCERQEMCYPSLRNMYGTLCRQCLKKEVEKMHQLLDMDRGYKRVENK